MSFKFWFSELWTTIANDNKIYLFTSQKTKLCSPDLQSFFDLLCNFSNLWTNQAISIVESVELILRSGYHLNWYPLLRTRCLMVDTNCWKSWEVSGRNDQNVKLISGCCWSFRSYAWRWEITSLLWKEWIG